MHELSIAMSLLEIATEEADRLGATSVNAIHIKVGPLSGVMEQALCSAYDMAREATPLADCRLIIESVPLTAHCPTCNTSRPLESIQEMRCSICRTPTAEILTGRELEVTAMEINQ